jgi:hypothetical protein
MTEAGAAVWIETVGRVNATDLANDLNEELFATWCNLEGVIRADRAAGRSPSAGHAREAAIMSRRLFGG